MVEFVWESAWLVCFALVGETMDVSIYDVPSVFIDKPFVKGKGSIYYYFQIAYSFIKTVWTILQ
jgi:hypothetical protein